MNYIKELEQQNEELKQLLANAEQRIGELEPFSHRWILLTAFNNTYGLCFGTSELPIATVCQDTRISPHWNIEIFNRTSSRDYNYAFRITYETIELAKVAVIRILCENNHFT